MSDLIRTWENPDPNEVGDTVEEFLRLLAEPCWIRLSGKDRSRVRAVTTLLHGNEPSGTRALHKFLKSGAQPVTDVICLVGAVNTGLEPPGFAHRMLPGNRDLNRCFMPPFFSMEGRVAHEVLEYLRDVGPEALVDIHNTSGFGPAYAVGTRLESTHLSVASCFVKHYVYTDIRLGSLMEATEDEFPTVTIECGGAENRMADIVALDGLESFLLYKWILDRDAAKNVTVLKHPIRVCLAEEADVVYSNSKTSKDLTLRQDIDQFNYSILAPSEAIGWTNGKKTLIATDGTGLDRFDELFEVKEGRLYGKSPMRLFMATTNERIAKDDCVFYVIPEEE